MIREETRTEPGYELKFKSIHDVNKPWAYEKANGEFVNFECTDCI